MTNEIQLSSGEHVKIEQRHGGAQFSVKSGDKWLPAEYSINSNGEVQLGYGARAIIVSPADALKIGN